MDRLCFSHLRMVGLIVMIALITACGGNNTSTTSSPTRVSTALSTTATVETAAPSPDSNAALTETKPVWKTMENWKAANQIRAVLIDRSGDLWTGGPAGVVHWNLQTNTPTVYAIRENPESTNVIALSQTPDGAIWAGTLGNGLARFDGKSWTSFTTADGVPGNYIIAQAVTPNGDLWFTTRKENSLEDSHFVRFDGNDWRIEAGGAFDHLAPLPDNSIVGTYNEPYHGVSFNSQIATYDGQSWNDLGIYPNEWIDAVTVAPDGAIWFVADHVVYEYRDQQWVKTTLPWSEKDFPSVSSLAISKDGIAWFGLSHSTGFDLDPCGNRSEFDEERGVYRYDGKTWVQLTADDGLVDNKVCAITVDASGNIWLGSFDKGVSRFDGSHWISYFIP